MHMPKAKRQWSVVDLAELPDDGNRYEIIDGELFMTPSPSARHQDAVGRLYRLLADYLDGERAGHVYISPAEIVFSSRRAVQPDVFVAPLVGGRRPASFADVSRLLLAVEVLSPTTARADRVAKRTLFREVGVPEYWIVDLDARVIERSTPTDVRPELIIDRLVWLPEGANAPLVIELPDFFASVLDR
jgi:Uma2 family endonuclease